MPFSTLGLDPALLHALDEQGFHTATAIQRERDTWTFSRAMGAGDPNWQLTATSD